MKIKIPLDAIQAEMNDLDELSSSLTIFIAGCETGGNTAGANFAGNLKQRLDDVVRRARRSLDVAERMVGSVQGLIEEAEQCKQVAETTIRQTQARMDKLRRTMDGARATR